MKFIFTKKQAERVIEAFEMRAPNAICPLCGVNDWAVNEGFIFLILQDNFPTIKFSGSGIPLATLTCGNCGNMHMLNLMQLGIWEEFKEEAREEGGNGE